MAQKRDYYEVLGVERSAGADDIKRAYRQAAMKYHPDRNKAPEAESLFKEASEAYEVLSDAERRARYDRFGHEAVRGSGVHDFSHMGVDDILSMFGDLFGDAFGGGRGRGRRSGGVDLQMVIDVDLAEVASGVERSVTYQRHELCGHCTGSGAEPGTRRHACRTCGGYGQVEQQANLGFFVTRTVAACPTCRGRGMLAEKRCTQCDGGGRARVKRTVVVKIPAGIHEGQSVRVRGGGEPDEQGQESGDLLCLIRVKEHPFLQRDGENLVMRMPISFSQAALGTTIDVPTLNGRAPLKIPAGAQYGDVFKLSGQGLPSLRNGRRGDQIVQVLVEVPRKLTRRQQELLREFAGLEDKSVQPESKGIVERMYAYFAGEEKSATEERKGKSE